MRVGLLALWLGLSLACLPACLGGRAAAGLDSSVAGAGDAAPADAAGPDAAPVDAAEADAAPLDAAEADAAPLDAAHGDASGCPVRDGGTGTTVTVGARWTNISLTKPVDIAAVANIQLPGYFGTGSIVVILKALPLVGESSKVELQGGTGVKTSDYPLTYSNFSNQFTCPPIYALLGDTVQAPGDPDGPYRRFTTVGANSASFGFFFRFLPEPQPPLYVFNAAIAGTLNQDQLPTSTSPPGGPGFTGLYTGCFLRASKMAGGGACPSPTTAGCRVGADDLYIEVLGESIGQLLEDHGAPMDVDCDGSGAPNGYDLEVSWMAEEVVELPSEPAP